MKHKHPLFVVDVGNTRTKVCYWIDVPVTKTNCSGIFRGDSVPIIDCEVADSSSSYANIVNWLDGLKLDSTPCRWVVSSVNQKNFLELKRLVFERRPQDFFIDLSIRDVPISVEYECPERLGVDRAIAAFSGTRILGKGVPFLVVDVGTAATIDYVDSKGRFCGGAILPGPRLTAEALNAKTSQLPMISDPENSDLHNMSDDALRRPITYPATETQRAIRLGVVYSLIGAIASFYWKTRRRILEEGGEPDRLTLVLSGGNAESTEQNLRSFFDDLDANLLTPVPRPRMVLEQQLVIKGLYEIAFIGFESFDR